MESLFATIVASLGDTARWVWDFIRNPDDRLGDFLKDIPLWTRYGFFCLILFCETGLVIAPFLPGDSLLFVAGYLSSTGAPGGQPLTSLYLLMPLMCLAVILGDSTNYWIGRFTGPKIFHKDNVRFLNKQHLREAHAFYEKHGGKTVVIARFLPILRTFSPFVAGIGKMNYAKFLLFSVSGSVAWISTFVLGGYFFGGLPFVQSNLKYVMLAIIVISLLPAVISYLNTRRHAREAAAKTVASPAPNKVAK